jgi:hypothetical protein
VALACYVPTLSGVKYQEQPGLFGRGVPKIMCLFGFEEQAISFSEAINATSDCVFNLTFQAKHKLVPCMAHLSGHGFLAALQDDVKRLKLLIPQSTSQAFHD